MKTGLIVKNAGEETFAVKPYRLARVWVTRANGSEESFAFDDKGGQVMIQGEDSVQYQESSPDGYRYTFDVFFQPGMTILTSSRDL